jgi:hypothetical protein
VDVWLRLEPASKGFPDAGSIINKLKDGSSSPMQRISGHASDFTGAVVAGASWGSGKDKKEYYAVRAAPSGGCLPGLMLSLPPRVARGGSSPACPLIGCPPLHRTRQVIVYNYFKGHIAGKNNVGEHNLIIG